MDNTDMSLHKVDGTIGIKTKSIDPSDHHYLCTRLADLRKDDDLIRELFDRKALPPMVVVAFMYYVKTKILPHAIVFGLAEDLKLSDYQVFWWYSAPHIAQIALQFPIAWFLTDRFFPIDDYARYSLAASGCLLILVYEISADFGVAGLIFSGLLHGFFESLFLPQLLWTTWVFWSREEQPLRMSYWFSMSGLTTIVMSLFTYCLAETSDRNRVPLLILCYTTALFCVYTLWALPSSNSSNLRLKFLIDRQEKIAWGTKRRGDYIWMESQVQHTVRDTGTWLWCGIVFLVSLPMANLDKMTPFFLHSFNTGSSRILLNVPFGIIQMASIIGGGLAAAKCNSGTLVIILCLISIAGFMMLMNMLPLPSLFKQTVVGYCLTATSHGIIPLTCSWCGSNIGGATRQKCVIAFIFISQSLGSICGHLAPTPLPEELLDSRRFYIIIVPYFTVIGLVLLTSMHIRKLNEGRTPWSNQKGKTSRVTLLTNRRLERTLNIEDTLEFREHDTGRLFDEDFYVPYRFNGCGDKPDYEDEEMYYVE